MNAGDCMLDSNESLPLQRVTVPHWDEIPVPFDLRASVSNINRNTTEEQALKFRSIKRIGKYGQLFEWTVEEQGEEKPATCLENEDGVWTFHCSDFQEKVALQERTPNPLSLIGKARHVNGEWILVEIFGEPVTDQQRSAEAAEFREFLKQKDNPHSSI